LQDYFSDRSLRNHWILKFESFEEKIFQVHMTEHSTRCILWLSSEPVEIIADSAVGLTTGNEGVLCDVETLGAWPVLGLNRHAAQDKSALQR
jgi:hypothetical protein